MKQILYFIGISVLAYFIGALTFYFSSAFVYIITRLGNWIQSLPIWGMSIIFIIIGHLIIGIYHKLPTPKEK